jgi:hypothetical protein
VFRGAQNADLVFVYRAAADEEHRAGSIDDVVLRILPALAVLFLREPERRVRILLIDDFTDD